MKYNYGKIDDLVVDAIKRSYDEYLSMMVAPLKLAFVKKLKEDTGLCLKESKHNADIIFDGAVFLFKKTFALKEQRRQKLDALTKKLLVDELSNYVEKSNPGKINKVFSSLDINVIEEVLDGFLNVQYE